MAAIEKLFILDGGVATVEDGSIYSPGVNVGVPMSLSCNAYLLRHRGVWMLWDTGTQDDLVTEPDGRVLAHGIRGYVRKTLVSQLAEIGLTPDDIGRIVISHAHFDHVGNSNLFRKATWTAQRAEYDAMFGPDPGQFGYSLPLYSAMRQNEVELVDGDHDIFGDGAVRLIFTPGHTLGHCSLLVHLPETGMVLLSGDIAHNRENFRLRRVPSFNADREATLASMEKADALLQSCNGALWVNHDTEQSESLPRAPRWIV